MKWTHSQLRRSRQRKRLSSKHNAATRSRRLWSKQLSQRRVNFAPIRRVFAAVRAKASRPLLAVTADVIFGLTHRIIDALHHLFACEGLDMNRHTLNARDIMCALRVMLADQPDVAKHAISELVRAITRVMSHARVDGPCRLSKAAHLYLPVNYFRAWLYRSRIAPRIGRAAPVAMAAAVEYMIMEMAELSKMRCEAEKKVPKNAMTATATVSPAAVPAAASVAPPTTVPALIPPSLSWSLVPIGVLDFFRGVGADEEMESMIRAWTVKGMYVAPGAFASTRKSQTIAGKVYRNRGHGMKKGVKAQRMERLVNDRSLHCIPHSAFSRWVRGELAAQSASLTFTESTVDALQTAAENHAASLLSAASALAAHAGRDMVKPEDFRIMQTMDAIRGVVPLVRVVKASSAAANV